MAILKELVAINLVDLSFVNIRENKPNQYQVQIKCDYNGKEIEEYTRKHGLTIEEDKEKKYLLIFKP